MFFSQENFLNSRSKENLNIEDLKFSRMYERVKKLLKTKLTLRHLLGMVSFIQINLYHYFAIKPNRLTFLLFR